MRNLNIFRTPAGTRLAFRDAEVKEIEQRRGITTITTIYGSTYAVTDIVPEQIVEDESKFIFGHHTFFWTPTYAQA